jgi:alpha-galactosidase
VISGTVFLNGDDLTSSAAQTLARAYLTNPRMNAVARLGRSFRPVEGNTSYKPSDTFVLVDGQTTYLATFNFGSAAITRPIDLGRAGLDASRTYSATDLWSNQTTQVQGSMSVSLEPGFARLYRLQ